MSGAANQALGMATNAANQPFQLPVAPVAGFNSDQQQAFQQYQNMQGMAQPYYNQSQQYMQQSAAPVSGADVANYYNPYASSVLGNLQESQGQQMSDLTGRLTQQAGGVGANRIGVGQAELARQQNLATGQTMSGIYGQALSAAQQQKQMQANAGYGMANLGTTAQNAALQGTGALNAAGNQQQAQQQNVMNAPYQNQLAQLAYPFQTAQYLAGIAGGLGPTMGGTTTGNNQTTQPAPSLWSQILGGITGAAGAAGSMGAFNGGSGSGSYGQSYNMPVGSYSMPVFANGGGVNDYIPDTKDMHFQSGESHNNLKFSQPQQQQDQTGQAIGQAMKMAMMFLKNGGAVDANSSPYQAFADGGSPDFDDRFNGDGVPSFDDRFTGNGGGPGFGEMSRGMALNHYLNDPNAITSPGSGDSNDSVPSAHPNANPDGSINPAPGAVGSPENPYRNDVTPQATNDWRADSPVPSEISQGNSAGPMPSAPGNASAYQPTQGVGATPPMGNTQPGVPTDYPYPDITDASKDTSRNFSKSPWMALANAGFAMMAGTSPFAGVNIGKGLQAGVATLQDQRKELASEEGINQRAKQLALEAQKHVDQYTKMTPYQQSQTENQKLHNQLSIAQMNMKGWKVLSDNPVTGEKIMVQDGTNNMRIMKPDGSITVGNMNDPSSFRTTKVQGDKVSVKESEEKPPPPMGAPELSSDLVPKDGQVNQNLFRKGSPALAQATQEMKSVTQLHTKEANNMGNERLLVNNTKQGYATLMKDNDQDSFLTKFATMRGNNVDDRIKYARSLNEAARAAGKPPPINPDKIAAMEVISKDQKTLGMLFASNLSSREAFAGQQVGIESTPGLTQSPQGMLRLIAGYDAQLQYTQDKHSFFNNWIQKYGVPNGWQEAFEKQNPPERYMVRSMMENLPNRKAAEALPQSIEMLRKNKSNPEVINKFNKLYGNTASYWLNGKLDILGAQ